MKIKYLSFLAVLLIGCEPIPDNRHIYDAKVISTNQRIAWKPMYQDDVINYLANDTVVYYDFDYDKNGKSIVVGRTAIIVGKIH